MEISLIRHGRSTCTENTRMSSENFKEWVRKYDESGVFEEDSYPVKSIEKITAANILVTSDLNRSVASMRLLKPNGSAHSNAIFRETELPIPLTKVVKLKATTWALILRCLWFLGYSRDCESVGAAKKRAKVAAELLGGDAKKHTSVVLVGHGFFNRFIAQELRKMGWKGKKQPSSKHWYCTTYTITDE